MRAYFFTNMYLGSLQCGLQSQHVTAELFRKYKESSQAFDVLANWADLHKTTIILNGGYSQTLRELIDMFNSTENPYPWTWFHESEEAADGLLTCVGIVLPEKIYELSSILKWNEELVEEITRTGVWSECEWEYSKWEFELAIELNKYRLAS